MSEHERNATCDALAELDRLCDAGDRKLAKARGAAAEDISRTIVDGYAIPTHHVRRVLAFVRAYQAKREIT